MSVGPLVTISAPAVGTEYVADSSAWIIPNNATSVSVEIKCYNGSGALIAISSLTAILRNVTTSADASSFTASGANEALVTSSNGVNGSSVFAPAGKVEASCDHFTIQVTSYSGSVYSKARVRRSGAWVTPPTTRVRRTGAWVNAPTKVRRSGAWTQIA